ncbi:RusA family crossover junction endodeoxyribonuclease [Limosilactobacillus mucosae]|uniref:RusA family crossover junction endodeoxyribonuclease n=1 Tax=Limosilactobacillus mucosae TaxID=97478 RepID=UPI0008838E50|nr:RusA family crossover junction endodeoxyribonuclease [Limosilactobacillus mucosae]SDN53479.1 Holliday junction resolvase RusA (prophage-encoded endonuclease) [Limosilactobacillus mucosae]SEL11559.1 Holliday junction resolvase RusA (prophage-encoded endonuclease) [Limosilactobacillus mucosae]SFK24366.1 Holliday junction resolvase RusA (prophage-encoded endonuclease) [Limosilactobacillus mucosae]
MIKLILPIEPVAQARPRARRFGKGIRLYDPPKTAKFKRSLHKLAKASYHGKPLDGELEVTIIFGRAVQKSISKKERKLRLLGRHRPIVKPDLDNYIKSTLDALTGVLWVDDNAIVKMVAEKRYMEQPRIEIEVRSMANVD